MSRFLPYLIFTFFILCFALHPQSPLITHHLADPDDYMRLNEVVAWLQGQGWYDLSVPRMSPGQGTIVHWSRLVDLPIAAIAFPFISFIGITNAVMIAAFIVPLLWLALLLTLLIASEKILTGKDARLSCVFLLFAPMLLFNYTPGRVDHHGVQAVIAGFGLLSLSQIILDRHAKLFAVLSALTFACGLWIGAEALPWAILFIACLGIAAAWNGGSTARNGAIFGIFLPFFTAALIPIALRASDFPSRALSWFSPAYAIFAALAGAVLIIIWITSHATDKKFLRIALYIACALGAAVAFLILVPSALQGIFTDYDAFDATVALDNITEAQPLIGALQIERFMPASYIHAFLIFARILALPLIAFIACLYAAKEARGNLRLVWLAQSFFLLTATTLTLLWQNRVGVFMELFMLVPLAWLLGTWWQKLRWKMWDRKLFWAEIGAFLILGFIPVILLPTLVTQSPLYSDILLFPAARAAPTCPLAPVLATLNDPAGLGAKPHTIMNISDTGPELLFTTHHNVVAGNFDVPGNVDAFTFFHTPTNIMARIAMMRESADLVLFCRTAPTLYLGKDYYSLRHSRLQPGPDGKLHLVNIDAQQPLIERLIRGEIPSWLKPIEISGGSDYLLFEITDTGKK